MKKSIGESSCAIFMTLYSLSLFILRFFYMLVPVPQCARCYLRLRFAACFPMNILNFKMFQYYWSLWSSVSEAMAWVGRDNFWDHIFYFEIFLLSINKIFNLIFLIRLYILILNISYVNATALFYLKSFGFIYGKELNNI